ncbi:hypothetical protein IAU60_006684 [Kwoniella sp. DSM 27419]
MPIATPQPSPWGADIFPPEWTLSEWQRTTRDDPVVNMGRGEALPESAEVVIIGSGLAGTKTAHSLLHSPNPPASVVVLEAREACSGASGRNAGHCRPDAFRGFTAYKSMHGVEQAGQIIRSERRNLELVRDFIESHNISCEFTPRPTVEVILSDEFKEYCAQAYEDARAHGLDLSHVAFHDGEAAQRISRSPHALGAYVWPAASLNPSQLCYAIHRLNLATERYKLFTWTPVTDVQPTSLPTEYKWQVITPRGTTIAKKVVWATNGYTSLAMKEMAGLIVSCKAQALKLDPPPAGLEAYPRLEPSMSLRHLDRFYSVMQRPDDSIIMAAPRKWPGQTPATFASLFNTYDDTVSMPERVHNAFEAFCDTLPGGGYTCGDGTSVEGQGGLDYAWTGILGVTPDNVPFVGAVPDKEGQYVIAGFNGHGMARIFHTAPCLAGLIQAGTWDPTVPRAFEMTADRMERLRNMKGWQWHVSKQLGVRATSR